MQIFVETREGIKARLKILGSQLLKGTGGRQQKEL